MEGQLEVQRLLEAGLVESGIHRFQKRLDRARTDRAGSTEGAGRDMFGHAILKVAPAVKQYLEEAGNRAIASKWIKRVGADKAAYAVCRVVLDHIYGEVSTRKLALRVAEIIIDELRFRHLEAEAPGLFNYRLERFSTSHYGYRKAVLMQAIRWAEVDVSQFDASEKIRIHLGAKLLDIFVSVTGLVEHVSISIPYNGIRGVRQSDTIRPTPETQEWLRRRNDWLEDTMPTHAPLVVPPLPWGERSRCDRCEGRGNAVVEEGGTELPCSLCRGIGTLAEPGGYLFGLKGTVNLIRGLPGSLRREAEASIGVLTFAAINRLQETGWAVNKRVLAVVQEALESGGEIAGLPAMQAEELPAKPADMDTDEENRRAWRRSAAQVHERNRSEQGQRYEALKAVDLAERYSEYEAFFYVWNLDFRGRLYPVADILQPQGADAARGLLRFSEGVSLGPDGGWWLELHGANCLGEYTEPTGQTVKLSQLPLETRVELIDNLGPRICAIAADPWSDRLWQDADDPWQFLAFCFEYSDWCGTGQDAGFQSRLVCSVDGTANGLQHFSALLRDAEGADAVNMTARSEPSDIYQRVADAVTALLVAEVGEDKPYADLWLRSPLPVDRKLVKRPTMTSAYGSGRFGFSDQIEQYMRNEQSVALWRAVQTHFTLDGKGVHRIAARYVAKLIWKALGSVVGPAFEAMDWLQAASRTITKRGELTTWRVPVTGMRVIQPYVAYDAIQVKTVIAGQLWKPRAYQPILDKPVSHEQANGVSPNFIHSLDAAALQMTVVRACSQGASSFSAVHDSFGSHAGRMAEVSHTLRVAFLDLHSQPILEAIREDWKIEEELPPLGTYKIDEVLAADYFFC